MPNINNENLKMFRHFLSQVIKLCRSQINHIDKQTNQNKHKYQKGFKDCGGFERMGHHRLKQKRD